ncbi:stalk domain-containing protein [Ureibacillus aquaedulcis]|uniref:Stalk domain-containing protein n=1 Tax=Ureibacillus aquaedulcis TaxID=3058421 RepID=A0ABT8GTI9_9BACL|nr:stalk domain-containing protein [Ureibacillus sp. BA0131]MDN4494707.1 stalk domain-containing protein [Ureibacillus sp. BA0131]
MKKLFTSTILTFIAFLFISVTSADAAVKVVENYLQDDNSMYAFPNKQYIHTYASPSKNSKITGTVKRNGAFMIDAKMSNGWYKTRWFTVNNTPEYIHPQDIMLVRENDTGNYPEPVYPFPNPGLVAPAPAVTVPTITSQPTDDTLSNIEAIVSTLGFAKEVSPAGIHYYHYAPDGEIVRSGGHAALEFYNIPDSKPHYGEFRLLISGWDDRQSYIKGQIEKVPAAIREILKFYYPTSYNKIYSMLYKGYETGVDMDEYLDTMFEFDNREFRVEAYHEGAQVAIFIGKEGERYTSSFALPDNVAIVKVNGSRLVTEQPAIVENGNTLVPLRGIFEALGAKVDWNKATQTITAHKGENQVSLTIGKKTAKANGATATLSIAPKVKNGTTLVPLRFISQALGAKVQWDQENEIVSIEQQ